MSKSLKFPPPFTFIGCLPFFTKYLATSLCVKINAISEKNKINAENPINVIFISINFI
jgi:CRISPR/Cas system-associated protein Cas5 (RAMP superfamily)